MKVLYDVSHQGRAARAAGGRRGIFRATEAFLNQALTHPELDCRLTATGSAAAQFDLDQYATADRPDLAARAAPMWRAARPAAVTARATLAAGHHLRPLLDDYPRAWRLLSFAPRLLVNRLARATPPVAPVDVFHSLFAALPPPSAIRARARVLTIWDLLPITRPEFFPDEATRRMLPAIVRSARPEADWVICTSAATRADFCRISALAPTRVFVVPLAASRELFHPVTDPAAIAAVRRRLGIPAGDYLLSLSAIEPRKNLPHLIDCFRRVLQDGGAGQPTLVLAGAAAGADRRLDEALAALGPLHSRVVFTGHVPDADLAALYSGARAFVFPSLGEGFGLPPLEAMQCGVPVICSNAGALPEVTGDAAISVSPTDAGALIAALRAVLTGDGLTARLREQSLGRAAAFSWRRALDATVAIYGEILSVSHPIA